MNAKKVKKIKTYIESLEQIREAVEDLRDEENDLLDGMPDNLRYTQQYERAEAAHESLDTFEELNFLTKPDVLSELQKYANIEIQDRDELFPDVQRKDGKLINHRRIDFVIRKL